ncbi:MAG TPA: hypothetical protein VFM34_03415 [Moraxellaceae bacterium]|nr:hypothetical protein [Moraxellaceae bacterium]
MPCTKLGIAPFSRNLAGRKRAQKAHQPAVVRGVLLQVFENAAFLLIGMAPAKAVAWLLQ